MHSGREDFMKSMAILRAIFLLTLFSAFQAESQDLLEQPPGEGIRIGPFPLAESVRGVPLALRSSAFLALKEEQGQLRLLSRVIVDLSDLQRKVGAIIDTVPLPTDNCARFAADNLVPRIWGKQITINGEVATLRLNGDLDVWQCIKNPIPCSKVEWDGIVPRVVTFDCNDPIKNKINQPFDAEIALRLVVSPSNTVAVMPGDPQVRLGGTGGSVTEQLLQIVGVDIKARVKESLDRAINPDLLKASLPAELQRLDPTLTGARFFNNAGALAASLEMTAILDAEDLLGLFELFNPAPEGSP
jgi:hypothetical protein